MQEAKKLADKREKDTRRCRKYTKHHKTSKTHNKLDIKEWGRSIHASDYTHTPASHPDTQKKPPQPVPESQKSCWTRCCHSKKIATQLVSQHNSCCPQHHRTRSQHQLKRQLPHKNSQAKQTQQTKAIRPALTIKPHQKTNGIMYISRLNIVKHQGRT